MATTLVQPDDLLLTRDETAELLGVSPGTLAVWLCTKRYDLPVVKVGRSVRYRRRDIDRWLECRTIGQVEEVEAGA